MNAIRGRFRKRNLKHAKECSIQQRRGFACGVCRWKRRFGCSRNSAVSAARFESGFRERDGQGQHWRGPHSHGGFLKMIVCESGGHANGLTYFIFRFLRRPQEAISIARLARTLGSPVRMRMDVYYDHVYYNLSSENVPVIADVAEISFQAQAGGVFMESRGFLGKASELIVSNEGGIKYENRLPLWLRIFLFPWAFLCIPFILLYLDSARSVDWADPPVFGVIFSTFWFLILPLCFSGLILWFVLFGASVDLRLDSRSREATLQRKSLLRNNITRYPLAALQIFKVELMADYPTNDAAIVTLRMPDGVKVNIGCFFRDEEAKYWVKQIRKCIDAAS